MNEPERTPEDLRKSLEEALLNFRGNEELFEMNVKQNAAMIRMAFLAHISQGFTPEQALELVKARGAT